MELFHVFFLFLVAKLRRISFCFVCRFDLLSFWIPSIFLTPPPALCKYSSASSSSLPCRRFIFLSLTHAFSFSLACARSQLQRNQSKERHTSSVVSRRRRQRRRLRRKTSKTFLFSFGAFQIIFD